MIIYRAATLEDMNEVAYVHIITQPEYFTSTLGVDLLSKFYTEFLKEDDLFVLAIDEETERIVGFCMGNWYGSRAEKRWESKYQTQIIKRLFMKCLQFNTLAISRVFRQIKDIILKPVKKDLQKDAYYSHLLSLGVLPEYRGQHIASKMIDLFEKKCLNSSSRMSIPCISKDRICTIGAYKWNIAGCNLYKAKGYSVYHEDRKKLKFRKNLS